MKLENILDDLHTSITRRWYPQLFTATLRVLMALTFVPPSIKKILHQPFTVLPDSNPVGHYFHALMDTGFYYEFIGWAQLIAAILLLIPRTSHLGAMLFLPIIANIAVLTSSVGFVGTWLITILMTCAGVWLAAWEYDRLKPLVFPTRASKATVINLKLLLIPAFFAAGGAVMGVLWWFIKLGNFKNYLEVDVVLIGIGFTFGLIVAAHYRFMPVGRLVPSSQLE